MTFIPAPRGLEMPYGSSPVVSVLAYQKIQGKLSRAEAGQYAVVFLGR